MSFIERCPLFRASFKREFTVYTCDDIVMFVMIILEDHNAWPH